MATTLVVVELLIIGFEVLVWVVLSLWHFGAIDVRLDDLSEWDAPLVTLAVGAAYTLGIIGDRFLGELSTLVQKMIVLLLDTRIARQLWNGLCRLYRRYLSEKKLRTPEDKARADRAREKKVQRDFYMTEIFQPHAYDYFDKASRHQRLLRATWANSLITVAVLRGWYWPSCAVWIVALSLLCFVSFVTWYMTEVTRKAQSDALQNACCGEVPGIGGQRGSEPAQHAVTETDGL